MGKLLDELRDLQILKPPKNLFQPVQEIQKKTKIYYYYSNSFNTVLAGSVASTSIAFGVTLPVGLNIQEAFIEYVSFSCRYDDNTASLFYEITQDCNLELRNITFNSGNDNDWHVSGERPLVDYPIRLNMENYPSTAFQGSIYFNMGNHGGGALNDDLNFFMSAIVSISK